MLPHFREADRSLTLRAVRGRNRDMTALNVFSAATKHRHLPREPRSFVDWPIPLFPWWLVDPLFFVACVGTVQTFNMTGGEKIWLYICELTEDLKELHR